MIKHEKERLKWKGGEWDGKEEVSHHLVLLDMRTE